VRINADDAPEGRSDAEGSCGHQECSAPTAKPLCAAADAIASFGMLLSCAPVSSQESADESICGMGAERRIRTGTRIFQLKIQLLGVRPPVWRRLLVPGEISLAELHDVIQTAMGWTDSHLHMFEVGDGRYGVPNPDWGMDDVKDESRAKLFRLVKEGERLRYTYDFGDGWEHEVTVEKVSEPAPGTQYPTCTAGRRVCPPEDVGGPWGYENFLAALADDRHEDHQHFTEWIGGGFDPAAFDIGEVNAALRAYAWAGSQVRLAR